MNLMLNLALAAYDSSYLQNELYKKTSGIDPLKKAQAKQLLYSKLAKFDLINLIEKKN